MFLLLSVHMVYLTDLNRCLVPKFVSKEPHIERHDSVISLTILIKEVTGYVTSN